MKSIYSLMACVMLCAIPAGRAKAQCVTGTTINVITYDSVVVGIGNAPYLFRVPKFDPALGTLTEVRVQSVVSLSYEFELENRDAGVRNIRHSLLRYDDIYSDALIDPITRAPHSFEFGPFRLAAADNIIGAGPDYIKRGPTSVWTNDTLVNETLNNTADFMGTGDVEFEYYTSAGASFTGTPSYNGSITDEIKFNVSYVYCTTMFLNSNHINLTANAAGATSALLRWNTTNESQAKSYEVMVSEDGINFKTATILKATGNFSNDKGTYQYLYNFNTPVEKLYFRVKQLSKDNKTGLSPIRPVTWSKHKEGVYFVPTPSGNGISVQLPVSGGVPWQIDLFAVNGQLIQKNKLSGTIGTVIHFDKPLAKGIYVIRATRPGSADLITQKLMIR
ncbi:MAG: choice-of-anchor E domain-containing protein [Chitinophagaceae bacterium]|nr:MAG: choice-of-anchor E domain-containing protein [Chitinophagaceae bacterium]